MSSLTSSLPYVAPTHAANHFQGHSPSGVMLTSTTPTHCPGYWGCGSIVIEYDIPWGTQHSFHPNPGQTYDGTNRTSYLPDNREGQDLVARLQYAWTFGCTFSIGRSLTTGRDNVVIWSTIPHKTSLSGGNFGWPDPNFLASCGSSLDALGVPRDADVCRARVASLLHASVSVPALADETIEYVAPTSLIRDSFSGGAIKQITRENVPEGECSICLDPLPYECVAEIVECKHAFHQGCIVECLNRESKCPICRIPIGDPQGRSPSGSMTIKQTNQNCPGFAPAKAISITYRLPNGTQLAYHDNPGIPYRGTERTGYLPHNDDGIKLLQRLKYAWRHGLTFAIGTSLTTGQQNVVTWTSIHHKTSLHGGSHGFPAANYIDNCNDSLDALHVPEASKC